MVLVGVGAECLAWVELAGRRHVQMVILNEVIQVAAGKALDAGIKGVFQVEGVNAELVGHGDIGVIRHPPSDPMMPSHGLKPPDLVFVGEGDPVHFVGAEALKQRAEPEHALACVVYVWQHQRDDILFSNAA